MRLPPGVSEKDLSAAVGQFTQTVGKEWVFTAEEDMDTYRDAYTPFPGEPGKMIPSAAVAPHSVEQVQQIVRIANKYKIPLWTVSTGKNLGYGGAAPLLSGSVVLDLKRMNRILEVNEKHAYALVEPGVSFFDLYRYIQDKGLKVWIDVPDPGWGSPVGNYLEHGTGYLPYPFGDHLQAQCGMEVVLPNGEVMRTGMGALPGAQTWQQHKYGFGPYIDGMFSQSNFGIVTKMGIWLFPQPETARFCTVSAPKYEDIVALVDILRDLKNAGIVRGHPEVMSSLSQLVDDPELAAIFSKPGGPPTEEVERVLHSKSLGYWQLSLMSFWGPRKIIDAEWAFVKEQFSVIPGVEFQTGKLYEFPLDPKELESAPSLTRMGIPSLRAFSAGNRAHSYGHFYFSPIIPFSGEALLEASRVINEVCKEVGMPPLFLRGAASAHTAFPRALIMLVAMLPRDNDIEHNKTLRTLMRRLVQVCGEHGWGEYRAHPAFMDDVMNMYSYNNHALRRFHETVKDAIDPNGILSPGQSGVWPKRFRGSTA